MGPPGQRNNGPNRPDSGSTSRPSSALGRPAATRQDGVTSRCSKCDCVPASEVLFSKLDKLSARNDSNKHPTSGGWRTDDAPVDLLQQQLQQHFDRRRAAAEQRPVSDTTNR